MKANLNKVVSRLLEQADTSGVEDFVASAKKFGAKVKESNGLITITIPDTKKAMQFRSQYVDPKGRILDRKTWSKVQGEGPVKGGGAYWEVKAGFPQNKVVSRLQEQAAGEEIEVPFKQHLVDPKNTYPYLLGMAKLMAYADWSTTQRGDAHAVINNSKLTRKDAQAVFLNLMSFCGDLKKQLGVWKKDV